MEKVLVTGGCGFLGFHLIEKLIDLGVEIDVIDLSSKINSENSTWKSKINLQDCDINDEEQLKKITSTYDVIFHLAAISSPTISEKDSLSAFRTNVIGTFNILKLAHKNKCRKIIFPSGAFLYGRTPKYLPIDEKHPIDLSSVYGATKRIGEKLCKDFMKYHGIKCLIFRIFNSYGPRQSTDYIVPSLIQQGLQGKIEILNGKVKRDFIFVDDIITAFIHGASLDVSGGPINLGSGHETSVYDIAKILSSVLNCSMKDLNQETFGALHTLCDNSLAKKLLDWEPKIDIKTGLMKTIEWFKSNNNV